MQKYISIGVLGCLGISILAGCGEPTPGTSSDAEKKAFKGGPMPPEIAKKWHEDQQKNAEQTAQKMKEKMQAKAAAGGANAAGGQ